MSMWADMVKAMKSPLFKKILSQGDYSINHSKTAESSQTAKSAKTADTANSLVKNYAYDPVLIPKRLTTESQRIYLDKDCNGKYVVMKVILGTPYYVATGMLGYDTAVQTIITRPVRCILNSEHASVNFIEPCWGTNLYFRIQGSDLFMWVGDETPYPGYYVFLHSVLIVDE